MSSVSARLEALAETHRVNPLHILERFEERAAIIQDGCGVSRAESERRALKQIEAELESGGIQ